MSGLEELHHHVADAELAPEEAAPAPSLRGAVPEEFQETIPAFNSDEEAARYFLDAILQTDERAPMRSVLAPESPRMLPDLELLDSRDSPATNTKLVRFTQSHESIPVFGARALVELTPEREYVSVGCRFADVARISSVPSLDAADALERVAAHTDTQLEPAQIPPGSLRWFYDESRESWHLAWLLQGVPATPPEVLGHEHQPTHGLDPSPRDESRVDYLVDAHDGTILFYYSAQPTLGATARPMPTLCRGVDEEGDEHEFYGCLKGSAFEMNDPLRNTKTYDLTFQDLRLAPFPSMPITMPKNDWGSDSKAAVSAHVNARRVHDFYNDVLQRNGIDDARMELVSVVNVIYGGAPGTRVWRNAVWHKGKMWYGQSAAADGGFVSLSRELDIIAHELTHGVIDHSSQLVYQDESGALNESFCDIVGVIIKNWYGAPDREDVATWNWEIGTDFRGPGSPLRDVQDPTRTNMPDHYSNRYVGLEDYGGVHTNSNIHNKAAYNVLNSTDETGARTLAVRDAATLYYLCLVRLTPRATFREARQVLCDVAKTYFAGDPDVRDRKIAAIQSAYAEVGIE